MIDLEIVFSVIVGGALTLLGTLLGHYLQYRSERRSARKQRTRERFRGVRRYLSVCLQFADLISIPATVRSPEFGVREMKEFGELVASHLDEWNSLPVSSSARVIFIDDEEVLQWLKEMDEIRLRFYLNYRSLIKEGRMIDLEEQREELKELAAKASARLDELADRI